MAIFQVKIMPAADIANKCGRSVFFCYYRYDRLEDMAFMFDRTSETLYIPDHVAEPQKLACILSRMMKRKSNEEKPQEADYDRLTAMFGERIFYPASDMYVHYFQKRCASRRANRRPN